MMVAPCGESLNSGRRVLRVLKCDSRLTLIVFRI